MQGKSLRGGTSSEQLPPSSATPSLGEWGWPGTGGQGARFSTHSIPPLRNSSYSPGAPTTWEKS